MINEMGLGSAGSTEADLLAALLAVPSQAARHKIIARLARTGGEDAIEALTELAEADENLAAHASFAASVIAHRSGIAGYEPAAIDESELLPAAAGAPATQLVETHETTLLDDTYGLILGPNVACRRGGARRLAVAIDLTALARLLTTPAVAGVIAAGTTRPNMLILCSPAGGNTARVSVHHTTGTPAFVGTATVSGTSVAFRLTAVRAPSARATLTGTINAGILRDVTLHASAVA